MTKDGPRKYVKPKVRAPTPEPESQKESDGELQIRIQKASVILHVSRTSHGEFLFETEELEKLFCEMEADSKAIYPVSLDLANIRLVEEAKKDIFSCVIGWEIKCQKDGSFQESIKIDLEGMLQKLVYWFGR